jgi:hypothetical protein
MKRAFSIRQSTTGRCSSAFASNSWSSSWTSSTRRGTWSFPSSTFLRRRELLARVSPACASACGKRMQSLDRSPTPNPQPGIRPPPCLRTDTGRRIGLSPARSSDHSLRHTCVRRCRTPERMSRPNIGSPIRRNLPSLIDGSVRRALCTLRARSRTRACMPAAPRVDARSADASLLDRETTEQTPVTR